MILPPVRNTYRGTTGIQGYCYSSNSVQDTPPISNPWAPHVSSTYTKPLSFPLMMPVIKALTGILSTNGHQKPSVGLLAVNACFCPCLSLCLVPFLSLFSVPQNDRSWHLWAEFLNLPKLRVFLTQPALKPIRREGRIWMRESRFFFFFN